MISEGLNHKIKWWRPTYYIMCKFATYYPDENQYEPCHECEDCLGTADNSFPDVVTVVEVDTSDALPF